MKFDCALFATGLAPSNKGKWKKNSLDPAKSPPQISNVYDAIGEISQFIQSTPLPDESAGQNHMFKKRKLSNAFKAAFNAERARSRFRGAISPNKTAMSKLPAR